MQSEQQTQEQREEAYKAEVRRQMEEQKRLKEEQKQRHCCMTHEAMLHVAGDNAACHIATCRTMH